MTDRDLERAKHLHAFFDGELAGDERRAFEASLASDGDARSSLAELVLLPRAVVASLDAEAERIPEARFEQIWDEIDRTLDRDARLQQAAETNVSLWSRVTAVLRPLWVPAAAAVGVAVAVAFLVTSQGEGPSNTTPVVASKTADVRTQVPPVVTPAVAAPVEVPANGEAEIQRIEFGGRSGRIDRIEGERGGVMTVIWVTEDDETTDSERSL